MATSLKLTAAEEEMKSKLIGILREMKKKRKKSILDKERSQRRSSLWEDEGNAEAAEIADKIDALVEAGIILGILSKYVSPMRWY